MITDNHSGLKEHQTAKNKESRNANNIALLAYTTSTGYPHERKTLKDGAISVISPGGTKIINNNNNNNNNNNSNLTNINIYKF